MKRLKRDLLLLTTLCICMILVCGCEKELDLKYHDIPALNVIEATLSPDGAKVGITLTTPMDEPMNLTRYTDADVSIEDLTTQEVVTLFADENNYFVNPTLGVPGHEYRLKVERGGLNFEMSTIMYAPVTITGLEFNWISMPYDEVAVLKGEFIIEPSHTGEYFWVQIYRNDEIYKWMQVDAKGARNNVVSFVTMTSRKDTEQEDDDEVLLEGDRVTCTVMPITREMYEYLEALQNDSSGPSLFTGDQCLGYFMATSPQSATITFHQDAIPYFH